MKKKFHRLRRSVGAVLLLVLVVLPFLRIKDESAFRFDVPTLRLLFFGTATGMADFFIILIGLIFVTFFILLLTILFGRVWCGWLCPQTVLCDATVFVEKTGTRGLTARSLLVLAGVLMSTVVAFSLIGYFIAPADIPDTLRSGGRAAGIAAGSWLALSVLLYLDAALLRRKFCATVCPYAKLQGVLFDDRTLLVAYDRNREDECMDCRACVRACPVGIDIRQGTQAACIHCAECVDACSERMAGRNRQSLVQYSFGIPGTRATGARINPVITGIITGLSLLLLLWLSASRMPFDVTVRLAYTGEPEKQTDGSVTNAYELSFRNLASEDLELEISAGAPQQAVSISPAVLVLKRGQDVVRIPAAITIGAVPDNASDLVLSLTFRSKKPDRTVTQTVTFLLPGNK